MRGPAGFHRIMSRPDAATTSWTEFGRRVLPLLAVFLVVFGARLWLIDRFGSPIPFMDQWDAEARVVIKPWLDGDFTLAKLFAPHNEHRVVLTKLVTLALFCGNGQWDPALETVVGSLTYAVAALLAAAGFAKLVAPRFQGAVIVAVILMGALPFAWENTLFGFQAAFYLLALFSLIALWGLGTRPAFSGGWWLGVLAGLLACFAMASGFFAAASVLAVLGLVLLGDRRATWNRSNLVTAVVCLGLVLLGLFIGTVVPGHAVLRARSLGGFIKALAECLAWPWTSHPATALVIYAPLAALAWRQLSRREWNANDVFRSRGLWLVAIWVIGQAAAVALLRGGGWASPSSRYTDIFAFGVLVNFCAILRLVENWPNAARARVGAYAVASAWTLFVLVGLARQTRSDLAVQLPAVRAMLETQESNVREFVLTGDPVTVAAKGYPAIPYPNASPIIELVGDPEFRKILPSALRRDPHASPAMSTLDPGPLSRCSSFLLRHAMVLLGAGLVLLLFDLLGPLVTKSRFAEPAKPR
jgi:hypothetical protein